MTCVICLVSQKRSSGKAFTKLSAAGFDMEFEFETLLKAVDRHDKEKMKILWEIHEEISRLLADVDNKPQPVHKRDGDELR
jgi:hypothetical protein